MGPEEVVEQAAERLSELMVSSHVRLGEPTVDVLSENALEAARILKDDLDYNQFVDCAGVDLLDMSDLRIEDRRYMVVYQLRAYPDGRRIRMRVSVDGDPPTAPSLWPVWKGCDWTEREAYDMFGIVFEGHPDLRRILMPVGFPAHPLRKDYPLQGRGERNRIWQQGPEE
jgi:NADH-quinone oxidoreductase subunit C